MPVPFDQIPQCAWEALKWFVCWPGVEKPDISEVQAAVGGELLFGTAVTFAIKQPAAGQMGRVFVTNYGKLALAWLLEAEDKKGPAPIERALSVLTPDQARIMEYLWAKKTARYDTLVKIPGAFRAGVTDEAITKKLKDMKKRLERAEVPIGYITVSTAKRQVSLDCNHD